MMKPETEVLHLIIPINIQSFSDVITNSSSEIFCAIKGDKETILFINNLLFNLLGERGGIYDDDVPAYELLCKSDLDKDSYSEEQWENLPEYSIQVSLPYSLWSCFVFFKEGLKALLENSEVKDKYKLEFYE